MEEADFKMAVERIQCQFLCCYPLSGMQWQSLNVNISWAQQGILIAKTMENSLNLTCPINITYQIKFLKRLIILLEGITGSVHDSAYVTLCKLQQRETAEASNSYAYKHYQLAAPHSTIFTLRESKCFVTDGTTGLCSWQASLALADFLLHNPEIVRDRAVIELGAGTGLCGFIASRCCGVRQMLLTDGSAECVTLMREHIHMNFPTAQETSEDTFQVDEQILGVALLQWDQIDEINLKDIIKPNVLLAADVIYDESDLPDLTYAIDYAFKMGENRMEMLVAATVRNEHTLVKFLQMMQTLNFFVEDRDVIDLEHSFLFWDRSTPVRIFLITRDYD